MGARARGARRLPRDHGRRARRARRLRGAAARATHAVRAGGARRPVVGIIVAAFAEEAQAERLVAPLRALRPLVDVVGPMPYTALQQITDEGCPHGVQNHWKAAFLEDLPDAAIADAIDVAADIPSPLTVVLQQPLGGSYGRVDEGATALSHRSARWSYHALSLWPDPANTAVNHAWTTRFAAAMAAYGDGGVHPNHVSDPAGERVRAFYGEATYERLVAVKDRWDPRNVFAANQTSGRAGADARSVQDQYARWSGERRQGRTRG